MIRGTTPDYTLTLPDYDLTGKRVYVTIGQRGKRLTLTNEDVDITVDTSGVKPVSTIAMTLTQEQTLGFVEGSVGAQVSIIDSEGHVDKSKVTALQVDKTLLERVITYDATGSPN